MGTVGASRLLGPAPGGSRSARRLSRSFTTPVALRLALGSLLIGLALLNATALRAISQRQEAVDDVKNHATPLLLDAESLYVALADADAAASTAFLQAGLEPAELRHRYVADIELAGRQLAKVGARGGLPDSAHDELSTIAQTLSAYTGLIETARTNNRLQLTVGAAYQGAASDLMREQLLPAATRVYKAAAQQLDRGLRSGTSRSIELAVGLLGAAVLLGLVIVHVFVTIRTRRVLNLGLIACAVLVVGAGAWTASRLDSQRDSLVRSQREGSDPILILSTARILSLRSLSDENLDLIERGTDQTYVDDFESIVSIVGGEQGTSGLLADAADNGTVSGLTQIRVAYVDYVVLHDRVRELADDDAYGSEAMHIVKDELALASARLDEQFANKIVAANKRLDMHAAEAFGRLREMPLIVTALVVLAGLAATGGLWPRVREYR